MTGRRLRPHCSQAPTATARQCAAFDCAWASSSRTTLRWLKTGWMRRTPSSVAFCTMKSMRSPRGTHCSSVTASGDSRSTAAPGPTVTITREPRTEEISPASSRPSPLNSTRASPLRARSTFAMWLAVSGGSSTLLPSRSSVATKTRVRRMQSTRYFCGAGIVAYAGRIDLGGETRCGCRCWISTQRKA